MDLEMELFQAREEARARAWYITLKTPDDFSAARQAWAAMNETNAAWVDEYRRSRGLTVEYQRLRGSIELR